LNPGPPALEASTLPLGYRGGGAIILLYSLKSKQNLQTYLKTTNL